MKGLLFVKTNSDLQFGPFEVKTEVVDRWVAHCQEQGGQWKALKLQGGYR